MERTSLAPVLDAVFKTHYMKQSATFVFPGRREIKSGNVYELHPSTWTRYQAPSSEFS
jgi:hypothetical protein